MKISVAAPVILAAPRILPQAKLLAEAEAVPPVPTHIDLTRQLAFGNSTVDEAGVVLVEMSVLVYRSLDEIRDACNRLPFDRAVAMDKQGRRDDDWRWLENHAAKLEKEQLPKAAARPPEVSAAFPTATPNVLLTRPIVLPVLTKRNQFVLDALVGRQGMPTSSFASAYVADGLAKEAAAVVKLEAERVRRADPPRVLAVLHGECALIAFRGTATGKDWLKDWLIDLSCWPALSLPLRHQGFEWTWKSVQPHVVAWLEEVTTVLGHPPKVYLTGHSLGGAVATLAAVELAPHYDIARVVTLGSPRVGSWNFRRLYQKLKASPSADGGARYLPAVTTRWVHGNDIFATFVPPPGITAHVVNAERLLPTDRTDVQAYIH